LGAGPLGLLGRPDRRRCNKLRKAAHKRPVVDLAHYLKPYGCGMFSILCCRKGASGGAAHAIREQWIGGEKLIVVLSDETLLDMIQRKSSGRMPEELLRHQIARFRKSL
jgi:hypothetical protein